MASLSTQLNIAMGDYVYESPDGGETVYRRKIGAAERELHRLSEARRAERTQMKLRQEWLGIRERAHEDPTLQDMVDQLIVYYRLKYEQQI